MCIYYTCVCIYIYVFLYKLCEENPGYWDMNMYNCNINVLLYICAVIEPAKTDYCPFICNGWPLDDFACHYDCTVVDVVMEILKGVVVTNDNNLLSL